MPSIPRFKFKKANARTKLVYFDTQPSWGDLTSKIVQLFDIPVKDVGVAFVDKSNDAITLDNDQDLQHFYQSLDQSPEEIKFVVLDLSTPDGESTFSFTHQPPVCFLLVPFCTGRCLISRIRPLPCVVMTCPALPPLASYLSLLHQPKPRSPQVGQWIPTCLNYQRVVSNQQRL